MIMQEKLDKILSYYKKYFIGDHWWEHEKFKWEAVKWFQDHWNINAPDFAEMLHRSLDKTSILLASTNNFPRRMIVKFAKADPEEVRAMFLSLFDEERDFYERIADFKARSTSLLNKYAGDAVQHFQNDNSISTYLWLRYPDKYYIYKFSEVCAVATELQTDYRFKKGAYAENIRQFIQLYDEINAFVKQDTELFRLLQSQLTDSCYLDPELKTLTIDVGFYISRVYSQLDFQYESAWGKFDLSSVDFYAKEKAIEEESEPETIHEEKPIPEIEPNESFTKSDFLKKVFMSEQRYDRLVGVLRNKMNIILQGAPGVGKTFAARRLAWSMMGEKDDSRIEFVQFHQNYSYEDFMMGYRPVDDGFELKYGIFYRFCRKAAAQPEQEFFFIIDEINRGNLSKIFGELLMLIEKDYRGTTATLAYNGESFSVPENLYIIGMMNTADRSLAMIDYALRRRFSFFDMTPGFDSDGFIQYQNSLHNETFNELISKVKELNREITSDKSLGKGFCIGHSYFCNAKICTDEWLHAIVDYDILPMLREYWFDEETKLRSWENILQGVFQ